MTPEFKKLLESYPDANPEDLKMIFIRDQAKKALVESRIPEATNELLMEIATIGTVNENGINSDDDIREHLKNLETARKYLNCHIQGLNAAWAAKLEPEFKARREKNEIIDKVKKATKNSAVADLVAKLLAANANGKVTITPPTNSTKSEPSETRTTNPGLIKVECPKCNEKVFSLKFHSCK